MKNSDIAEFFAGTKVSIVGNQALREPQRDGYFKIKDHCAESAEPGYVQLPVGCGKTGLIGLAPFGSAKGRVLIVAPNVTIRRNILRELDISDPNCFYSKRGVFVPTDGPFITELKTGAGAADCDAAHMIVANIQQFAGEGNKWYQRFDRGYFRMILVDEGHHNVASTWQKLFAYFDKASVVSFTATPMRSDGETVQGRKLYSFSYTRSMMMGFIAPIEALFVHPEETTFTVQGETKTLSLDEVLRMREYDWFSRGVAASDQCNRHIANASVLKLRELRKHGTPRQIIAVACSIRHAGAVAALYREHGLNVEVLHSNLDQEERDRIEAGLRTGVTDVVVQVQMLGEGYDLGTLGVAAIFRPYRSLSPYIQFVGRVLRLADPSAPSSPGNKAYLISHVGLNDERWWEDFQSFDKQDQAFFAEFLAGESEEAERNQSNGEPGRTRLSLRPFMRVLSETVEKYVQRGFLREIDDVMVDELLRTIRSKGFDPAEFGLDSEVIRTRLEMSAMQDRELAPFDPPVQPQRRKEALQKRLSQEARSIADTVVNRLDLKHAGRDLLRHFPGRGDTNAGILVTLANGLQNKVMGVESGQRQDASGAQFQIALDATADIVDSLSAQVRAKLKK